MHPDPVFLDLRRTAPAGVEQPDSGPNELLEVLVAGHHDHLVPLLDPLARQGTDDVVRLEAIDSDDGDSIGCEQLADAIETAIEILLKFLVELLSCRLVLGEDIVPERPAGIENPGDVIRLVLRLQSLEEVDHSPGGGRILAA